MKGLIVTGIIGLVFFGGAYAYSTMQLVQKQAAEDDAEDELGDPEQVDNSESDATVITDEKSKAKASDMPVPFAPKQLSEQAILALNESIIQKEKALKKREAELKRREENMRFIVADINREKREFEAVVQNAQSKVTEAQRILEVVETKKQKIENDLNTIKSLQSEDSQRRDQGKEAGDKQISAVLKMLDPATLATLMKKKADDGELEKVGRILSSFDDITMSKVIGAIADIELQDQALEAVRQAAENKAKLNPQDQNR